MEDRSTQKKYKQFTKKQVIDLNALIESGSLLQRGWEVCYTASGRPFFLQAESLENEFFKSCRRSIQRRSDKTLSEDAEIILKMKLRAD